MALMDYAEEFILYSRQVETDFSVGSSTSWKTEGSFFGAILLNRIGESKILGTQIEGSKAVQISGLTELYKLYVPDEQEYGLRPVYDDYIERVRTGEIYRVASDLSSYRPPQKASLKFGICTIVKTELPEGVKNVSH